MGSATRFHANNYEPRFLGDFLLQLSYCTHRGFWNNRDKPTYFTSPSAYVADLQR